MTRFAPLLLLAIAFSACTLKEEPGSAPASATSFPAPPDVAAPPADALKTASGLASKVLQIGMSNARPSLQSTVKVNYAGWTPDGKMFDASALHGGPAEFPLTGVIPGWTEGLQLMVVGEKRRFWIPGALAYDKIDMPGAPKGPLVFEIELLAVR